MLPGLFRGSAVIVPDTEVLREMNTSSFVWPACTRAPRNSLLPKPPEFFVFVEILVWHLTVSSQTLLSFYFHKLLLMVSMGFAEEYAENYPSIYFSDT